MGVQNSWIASVEDQTGCTSSQSTFVAQAGSCILWLIAGVILGGLTFSKKRETR